MVTKALFFSYLFFVSSTKLQVLNSFLSPCIYLLPRKRAPCSVHQKAFQPCHLSWHYCFSFLFGGGGIFVLGNREEFTGEREYLSDQLPGKSFFWHILTIMYLSLCAMICQCVLMVALGNRIVSALWENLCFDR